MTLVEMILKMRKMYGADHEATKQFEALALNPDVKKRHLETIVKCHEKKFEKFSKKA